MNPEELKHLKVDRVVDARGVACPGPLLEAKREVTAVPMHGVMEVISSDEGTTEDVPLWAKKVGHEYPRDASRRRALARLPAAEQVVSEAAAARHPKVLVFSTNAISDMGIDLAGSSHMDYSAAVRVIAVPCSGGINPAWILHAVQAGFDGVFVAADGAECAFLPDCVARTGRIVADAQTLLRNNGVDPARVKTAAICSVCSEPFVNHMKQFGKALGEIPAVAGAPA